jgi:hypothetical protein
LTSTTLQGHNSASGTCPEDIANDVILKELAARMFITRLLADRETGNKPNAQPRGSVKCGMTTVRHQPPQGYQVLQPQGQVRPNLPLKIKFY